MYIRKIVFIVIIFTFMLHQSHRAYAVIDPFSIALGVSALLHTVVIGGAVAFKYYKRENGGTASTTSHKVNSSSGSIGREATVTWVTLTDNGQIQENSKNVSAKVSYNDITTLANTSQYPNIKIAIDNAKRSYTLAAEDTGWDVGNVYYDGSAYYQWTSKDAPQVYSSGSASSSTGSVQYNSVIGKYYATHTFGGTNGYTRQTFYGTRLGTTPPSPLATPDKSKFVKQIDTNSDSNIENVFKGEIDDFIKSNPNIVHYSDTADPSLIDSASDFVGPPTPSATDLATAIANRAASDATRNAWLNYSSNKTDGAAKQKWLDRLAQDARDQANDQVTSDQVKKGVKDALEESATGTLNTGEQNYGQNPDAPEKKDILSMIRDRMASILSSSPLLGIINNTRATASGEVSTLTFYLGIGNAHKTIDFEPYSGPISVLGSVILSFAHILAVFILFRGD